MSARRPSRAGDTPSGVPVPNNRYAGFPAPADEMASAAAGGLEQYNQQVAQGGRGIHVVEPMLSRGVPADIVVDRGGLDARLTGLRW